MGIQLLKITRLFLCTVLLLSFCTRGYSTTYYNKSSGVASLQATANWGTATNGTGTSPANFTTAGDVFNLYNGSTGTISAAWVMTGVTLNVGNGAAMNLTIPSGFSLTGTGVVNVSAAATLTLQNTANPTLGTLNATSTVNYNGTGAQTIALGTYGNLTLSGARTGTPAITLASGTINIAGSFSVTYTGAVTFTTTGSTVIYNTLTGGSTVGGITYNNLTLSNTSGTNTAGGNITVGATLTTTAGGTLDMGTNVLSSVTTLTNNGTLKTSNTSATPIPGGKAIAGTVVYGAAAGGQTIVAETSYNNLTLGNTSGTNTAGGNLVVNGTLTTTAGGTMDMTSAYTLAGTLATITNNGTISTSVATVTSATPIASGKTWGGSGQVEFAAATGAQTIMAGTYNCGLKLSNTSGTNTASAAITVNGTLTTTSGGILDMGASALAGTTTPVNNGTIYTSSVTNPAIPSGKNWTGTTGVVEFTRLTGGQFIPAGTYGTLALDNTSGTNTAVGAITASATLTTTAGGTLAMATFQLLGAAAITNNGTVTTTCTLNPAIPAGKNWDGTTGNVTFALTTGGQFIPAGTFGTLKVSNTSSTTTAAGALTVNTSLITTAGGTLDMSSYQLLGAFVPTDNGTLLTSCTVNPAIPAGATWTGTNGIVKFGLITGGQYVPAGSYKTLTFSNTSGTDFAVGNIAMTGGIFTTTAGGTLDMGVTSILSGTGTVTNGGTVKTSVLTSTSATPIIAAKAWGGTVIYGSLTGGQTIVQETSYTNLTLNNTSGTNTSAAALVVNGNLTTTAGGTLDMTSAFRITTLGGTITNNGIISTSVPTATSSTPLPTGKTWGGTGTVLYAATAGLQTVMAGTYNCGLKLGNTSGTSTASGVITANGAITTTSGGTLNMNTFQLAGTPASVINNGTITSSAIANPAIPAGLNWTGTTGNVTFARTTGGQFVPLGTYGTLKFSNTSGIDTAVGAITVNTSLVTTSGGKVDMVTNQLLGTATPTHNGTILTSCTVNPAIPAGQTWTGTTGLVTFALTTGGQYVPLGSYKTLTFSATSGTNTAVGNITMTGVMTITAGGTLDMGTANTLSGSGTFTNNGTLKTSVPTTTSATPIPAGKTWAGTVNYAATAGGQTVMNGTYTNLLLSNTSGTNTAAGNLVVNTGSLTTTAGGTLDMGTTALLSGSATFTNNGTIKTSVPTTTSALPIPAAKTWAGTIIYGSATGAQTIVSATSYNNLTLSNASGTNTSAGNLVVNGTLTTTAGGVTNMAATTLSGTLATITGGGTIQTQNTTAAPIASGKTWTQTIEYNKTTGVQTIVSGTYAGLTNSNTSGTNLVVAAGTVTVTGTLTLNTGSTMSDNGVAISLGGNIAGTGTHTGAGSITMTGSGATISGATLTNLTLNNAGGFSLTGNATINGTLRLTAGKLNIGTSNLIFGTVAPAVAGTPSSSNMIIANGGGQVQKKYSAIGSFLFPVGDNGSNYSPITLNFTAGTFAGGAYAGVKVNSVKHPQNSNTTDYLKRYWNIATSGITVMTYSATATYVTGDVTGTEANLSMGEYTGALPWVKFGATNTGTHTLSSGSVSVSPIDFTGISTAQPTVTISPATATICNGSSTTLTASGSGNPTLTYSWSPATGLSATTGSSVTASPVASGSVSATAVYTVTITDGNGFTRTATSTITVNPTPAITGTLTACVGNTSTLSDPLGGTWSSGNLTIATIGSTTGVVSGVSTGTATITFNLTTGCKSTAQITINVVPSAITGLTNICTGSLSQLTESATGGAWSSGNAAVATVGSAGLVSGVTTGGAVISYISGPGCYVTTNVSVSPIAAVTGTPNACIGLTTSLSDASTGGTWASSNTAIGTVGSTSGIVRGISAGVTNITYTLSAGCNRITAVTINAVPAAITGTATVCAGLNTTLSESVPGGTWSSSNVTVGTVDAAGVVAGLTAGTSVISYISGPSCNVTATITVNPLPAVITGTSTVCVGATTALTDATPGGTWVSSNGNASIGSGSGVVTGAVAGNSNITYTLPTGCFTTTIATINAIPAAITGTAVLCAGSTTKLSNATPGGTWSSSNVLVGTIDAVTGVFSGIGAGNPVITYTIATGCFVTIVATVNPWPASIAGTPVVCAGLTTTLTDASAGGTWSSSNGNATIGSASGVVSAVSAGISTITYTLPTGCINTVDVTVNPLPAAITGTTVVCVNDVTSLDNGDIGGSWSSSNIVLGSVDVSTGDVTGISAGTLVITYTLPTGCIATTAVTVNPIPSAILGITVMCDGDNATLSDATPGGTWVSSDITNVIIGSASGAVSAVSSGTATISYQFTSTGCANTSTILVNDVPSPINGNGAICNGSTSQLSDDDAGGTWSSNNTGIATIGSTDGIVHALSTGLTVISYTFITTGCSAAVGVAVDSTPTTISGNNIVCLGFTAALSDLSVNGTWGSANTAAATIDTFGTVTAITADTTTISYAYDNGCAAIVVVTVSAIPSSSGVTNNSPSCSGAGVTLDPHSSDATAWSWIGSDGYTSTLQNPVTTPTVNTTYSVTVSNSGVGCAPGTIYTTVVTVNPLPSSTGATNNSPICIGSTVTLNDHSSNATAWSWSGPGGYTSTQQTPTLSPTVTGVYSLTVSRPGTGCSPATVYTTLVTVNSVPTSTGATNNGPICVGGTVTFDDHSTGATAWLWTGPAGFTSTLQTPSATPTVTGTYSLVVSSTGSGCAPATVYTTSATVNAVPTSTGATNNGPICSGGTVTFNDHSTGATAWLWTGPGAFNSTLQTPSATPTITGTYSLAVSRTGSGCSPATVYTTSVTVNVVPTSTGATNNSPICAGGTVTFNDHSTGATIWSWTGPAGFTSTLQTPTATPTITGTYSLVVSSTGSGCNPGTVYTTSVTVNAVPTSTGATNNGPICVSGTVTFNDHSTGATAWSWTGPGGFTSTLQTPSATPTVTGTYSLMVSRTGSGCAPATIYTTSVTVNAVPTSTGATNNGPICVGATVTFNDHSTGAAAWTWTGPSGFGSTLQTPTATPTITGTYSLVVSRTGSGCSPVTVYTTSVTVNPVPTSTGATNTSPACAYNNVTLNDNSSNATAWAWSGPSGYSSTVQSPVITPSVSSVYSLTVSRTGIGCSPAIVYTTSITMNAGPAPISGVASVCIGYTTALTDVTAGGVWTSVTPSVATVGTNGVVTAVSVGTTQISYTIAGCTAAVVVTVSSNPSAISGATNICYGASATLTNAIGGGTWASSNTLIATVGSGSGVVSSVSAGVVTITYQLGTGCLSTTNIVISPVAAPVTGTLSVCVGGTTALTDATAGGSWISSNSAVATISLFTGVVTGSSAGTSTISYTLTSGCNAIAVVTVNSVAPAISGTNYMCSGAGTTLSDATGGGTWSSSDVAVATIGSGSGVVSSVGPGTATVTYTLPSGCATTRTISVNALPATVTVSGSGAYCVSTTVLAGNGDDGIIYYQGLVSGGTSTVTPSVSEVATVTGTYYFRAQSTAGCWGTEGSASVTINPLPAAISGATSVCVGASATLTDGTAGGTWSSSAPAKATIGSATGSVTGIAAGTTIITYTAATGCKAMSTISVNGISAINGTGSVCAGTTTTLTDGTPGGTWISSDPSTATIGSASGLVTGVAAGTADIIYTLGTGCEAATTVTVNTLPSTITGVATVCAGLTTNLTNAVTGGTWTSSNTSSATIGSATGIVTGVAAGTSTITYVAGTGCKTTSVVTVNALPGNINGTASVCVGLTTTLSSATAGGRWSSSDLLLATVGSTGIVTGVASGNPIITYVLGTGCLKTATITVNPLTAVTGSSPVCVAGSVTLANATSGGTWSSSAAGTASVVTGTGIVTGVAAGTATITYLLPTGCRSTTVVTVNAIPGVINGTSTVCAGLTTTLTNATAGGTWSSSDGALATIGTSGIVTGVAAGNPVITYILGTGCARTATLTVNALAAITGNTPVCISSTVALNDAASGGTWTSIAAGVASVIGSTGVVSGVAAGTATISYTLGTGCRATAIVTVNSLPLAITGSGNVCVGSSLALTDATTGGTWSSSNGTLATVDGAGSVTGVGAGIPQITYTLATGCYKTSQVTVNPVPTTITGTMTMCAGSSVSLANAVGGGLWTSSTTAVATVGSANGIVTGVTGGTSTITYTMAAGCYTTAVVTVNAVNPITGFLGACVGSTTSLADATIGGTWASSNPGVATIGTNGLVTGIAVGSSMIIYTIPSGCVRTAVVPVANTPSAILGNTSACVGYTTTLSDAVSGGTWSSSNIFNATVGSLTGIVSGVASGTARISYVSGFGCYVTQVVSINAVPTGIGGPTLVCPGSTINLTDFTAGGAWTSSNSNATIDGSAHVTGVSAGPATISYTIPTTGCFVVYNITVNSAPQPITGATSLCATAVSFLTDATTGGIAWTSDNTSVATVSGSGGVTGISAGTANITYTISNNCSATTVVTVNPLPGAITNNIPVCTGLSTTLSNATTAGAWSSSNASIATIGSLNGTVTGVAGGTAIITYLLNTGCKATAVVTINAISAITGNIPTCIGNNLILTDASSGGTWSSDNTGVATVGSTGIVSGAGTGGNATISYVLPSGCVSSVVVTFNQAPSSITGTSTMCFGFTTVLTDATSGGIWSSNAGFIATVGSTGVVTGVLAGTATISYTTAAGCYATALVTVNPQPSNIGGSAAVCLGSTITLSDFVAGGTWSSSNSNTSVDGSGHVNGLVVGSSIITYTLPTSCYVTFGEQVNPLPTSIGGQLVVCAGSQALVTDATTPGLSWSSSNTSVATIINSGVATGVAAGTTTLTYTLPTGCATTGVMTVLPTPAAVTGNAPVCLGGSLTLNDITASGTWSSLDNSIATIGSTTGVVNTVTAGFVYMQYTTANGCSSSAFVTVNPIYAITGNGPICMGQTLTLSDAATGGAWSTGDPSIATVDAASGIVTPVIPGTATISYLLSTGCSATTVVTVTGAIASVTGAAETCSGPYTTITLGDVTPVGTWTSSNSGIATVGSADGIVTGVSAGIVDITYSIGMGCVASATVTIDQAPSAVLGANLICAGLTTTLTNSYPDGSWTTGNSSVAQVSAFTGLVTGMSGGTANISYTLLNGCYNFATVTVNPLLSSITGTTTVCIGGVVNLTNADAGGSWSSSNVSVATTGTDGAVNGVSGGPATITYTASTGCLTTFDIVVNPYAGNLTGVSNVNVAAVTHLSDLTGGGTWTSSNGHATVDGSGNVTGVTSGTVTISYTVVNICGSATATMIVTVNSGPTPVTVTASGAYCGSTTITADNGSDGVIYYQGTTSGGTSLATPSTSQLITVSGTYYFRAYLGGLWGAEGSATVTINPLASAITGTAIVCTGANTSLTDAGGGTWASSDVSKATVGTSGIVTGVATGTAVITYTLPAGCTATRNVTVIAAPSAITGTAVVCEGSTTNLTDAGGGTWSSNNTLTATVGSTGVVTGVAAGNTTITYTIGNGCVATKALTVSSLPALIAGNNSVCLGASSTLSDATAGGAWSSSDIAVATISTAGSVTGLATGTASITYTTGAGCIITAPITVNSLPAAISGAVSGICAGGVSALTDVTIGGVWSSGNSAIATIGSSTGIATAVAAGVTQITYTLTTGCIAATNFSVISAPAAVSVSGAGAFCNNTTITASGGSGGSIYFQGTNSGGTSTASLGTSQVISSTGTYYFRALSFSGCWGPEGSVTVTINASPAAITGTNAVCVGSTTSLTDAVSGGTWSSSDVSKATVGSTGIVSGVASGTATITYASGAGCITTILVAIDPLPGAISGASNICAGSASALSTSSTGGLWSSSNLSAVTIGSATGIASAVAAGTAVVTYTLPTGCITTSAVTVNALPATVIASGGGSFCGSTTITAANGGDGTIYYQGTTSGGTSTATPSSSQIIATSGTYYFRALSASGCWGTQGSVTVTINALPASISGSTAICVGSGGTLSDVTAGGTWTSSNSSVAIIGSANGVISALTTGTSRISYTLATGCSVSTTITVNPVPSAITGTATVCVGSSTGLTDATTGGTWSSGNTFVATVGSTGIVSGVISGNAVITYSSGTGCIATATVTVNAIPSAIIGTVSMCLGNTYNLTDGVAGGSWTSGTGSVATIGSTGIVSTLAAGTSIVSYALPSGCAASTTITVNSAPAAITGTATVCEGATTSLTDATAGGNWSSNDAGIATVSAGSATGIAAGVTTITYTLGTGCYAVKSITVTVSPAAITGSTGICQGLTTVLANPGAGGAWTSSNGSIASIGTTGIVTGVAGGTATISYLVGSCAATTTVTVYPVAAITGNAPVCGNSTIALTDAVAGGTWTSESISIASIGTDGVVTGLNAGTSAITYSMPGGCNSISVVTVNQLPQIILGSITVCNGQSIVLSDLTIGGMWASNNVTIATAGSASGVISGTSAGNTTITYTLATGCYATRNITVNALSPITGNAAICAGGTSALTDASAGGTWSCAGTSVATVGTSGILTGIAAGTATVSYTLASGCMATVVATVNAQPSAISGTLVACVGSTTALTDAGGGTWASGAPGVATVGTSGLVTGAGTGTAIISYTLPTGCGTGVVVTINGVPTSINGTLVLCAGSTTTLTNAVAGGTWSSSNTANATIGTSSGIVTGVAGGTAVISYATAAGCFVTAVVTVNSISPITGVLSACLGYTTTLANGTPGGTWSSSNTAVATVGATTGVVSGIAGGTVTIIYSIPSGCIRTAIVAVNALAGTVNGVATLCVGTTTTLTNTATGGTWSSSNLSVATVLSGSGVVTGVAAGTANITYTVGSGCAVTSTVTINASPSSIGGASAVCVGSSVTLSNFVAGGTWSSSNGNATIGVGNGIVNGVAAGTSTMTYTLASTGCYRTYNITINGVPAPITGAATVCVGATGFENSVTGGGISWSSSNTSVATITNSGAITGVAAGTTTITYTISTGCYTTAIVTVNSFAPDITGNTPVCAGSTITLTDAQPGGTWTSNNASIATVGTGSGIVTGVAGGTVVINYLVNGGCNLSTTVTVNPIQAITGNTSACVGSSSALADGTAGGTWSSANTGVAAVGSSSGVVVGAAAGTTTITYTLSSGCTRTTIVTINAMTLITGTAGVCAGSVTALTNATAGGVWSTSSPFTATVGTSGIVTGVAAGVVNITYAISGCNQVKVVTVNAVPSVIGGSSSVCTGSSVTLSDFLPGGTWSFSNSNAAVGSSSGSVIGLSAGTGTVTYMMPSTGCFSTFGMVITQSPSAIAGAATVAVGAVAFVSDPSPGGISWTSSNTAVATVSNSGAVTGVAAGTTTLTYTVSTGCFATGEFSVTPSAPHTAANVTNICVGSTVVFEEASTGGSWSTSDNNVAIVDAASGHVTGTAPGNATITYWLVSGFGTFVDHKAVHVDALPNGVTISAEPGLNISAGETLTLNADVSSGGDAPAYQWLVNGTPVDGATSPTFVSNTIADNDSVTCQVISSGTCSGYVVDNTVVVKVTSLGITTGLTMEQGIRIQPNPSKGEFTVRGTLATSENAAVNIEVTDVLGQQIYKKTATAPGGRINEKVVLEGTLANGMYILNIRTGNERKTFHFVIEK